MKKINFEMQSKLLRHSYLVAILLMIILIVTIIMTRTSTMDMRSTNSYYSINSQWTLTPGGKEYVDITQLGQYIAEGSNTLSLYWTIPEIDCDTTLLFRSKDIKVKGYIADELVYEPAIYESRFYLASPGNNWNFITVPSDCYGETIRLDLTYVYDTSAVTADCFYWGNKSDWILDFFLSKFWAVALSIIIIFVGLIVALMDHTSFERSGTHSLLYLGIYGVLMGIWSLLETNTFQIIFTDGRLIQLMDNLLMITDSIPLFFYLDAEFDILKNRFLRILIIIDIAYIFECLIGQFTGLLDIHNHLAGSWIATGLSFVILVTILFKQLIGYFKGEKIKKAAIIQIFGFVALMVIVILCMPVYLTSDGIDRAESIRFGMLVMILMFAIAGQLQTYELIQQGTRYDLIKSLAYNDALTGLLNRTSYLDALDSYHENPPANLGVIFFDINYLKRANDQYGHEMGDHLICASADIIRDSFSKYGKAYRTGGDEFIVFLEGENPSKDYKEGLKIFEEKIAEANSHQSFPFKIEIAHGFSLREGSSEQQLKQMIQNADAKMYENKRYLKGIVTV